MTQTLAVSEREGLLQDARDGDTVAFWKLMGAHERTLFAVAFGIVRDPERAQDIVHDTFVRAFSSLGSLRSASTIGAWLYGMARNIAHEHLRKDQRQERIKEKATQLGEVISVPELMMESEELSIMERALRELPEPYRVVLGLKYTQDLSCKEIAEILGIGLEAAKSRLFEARKHLRNRMAAMQSTGEQSARPRGVGDEGR